MRLVLCQGDGGLGGREGGDGVVVGEETAEGHEGKGRGRGGGGRKKKVKKSGHVVVRRGLVIITLDTT